MNNHPSVHQKKWQPLRLAFVGLVAVMCLVVMFWHDESGSFWVGLAQRAIRATSGAEKEDFKNPLECMDNLSDEWNSMGAGQDSLSSWMQKNPSRFEDAVLFDSKFGEDMNQPKILSVGDLEELTRSKKYGERKYETKPGSSPNGPVLWLVWENDTIARVDASRCRVDAVYFPTDQGKHPAVGADNCGWMADCTRVRTNGAVYSCSASHGNQNCPAHFLGGSNKICWYPPWDAACTDGDGLPTCPSPGNTCHNPICPLQSAPPSCETKIRPIAPHAASRELSALNSVVGFVNAINKGIPLKYSRAISVVAWFVTGRTQATQQNFKNLHSEINKAIDDVRACVLHKMKSEFIETIKDNLMAKIIPIQTALEPDRLEHTPVHLRQGQNHWTTAYSSCKSMGQYFKNRLENEPDWEKRLYVLPLAVDAAQECGLLFMAMVADYTAWNMPEHGESIRKQVRDGMEDLVAVVKSNIYFIERTLLDDSKCGYFKDQSDLVKILVAGLWRDVYEPVRYVLAELRMEKKIIIRSFESNAMTAVGTVGAPFQADQYLNMESQSYLAAVQPSATSSWVQVENMATFKYLEANGGKVVGAEENDQICEQFWKFEYVAGSSNSFHIKNKCNLACVDLSRPGHHVDVALAGCHHHTAQVWSVNWVKRVRFVSASGNMAVSIGDAVSGTIFKLFTNQPDNAGETFEVVLGLPTRLKNVATEKYMTMSTFSSGMVQQTERPVSCRQIFDLIKIGSSDTYNVRSHCRVHFVHRCMDVTSYAMLTDVVYETCHYHTSQVWQAVEDP